MTSAGASSESEWLVSRVLDVGEFRDCDGRPIGEGKVPKERRPRGVPFELRPCPYPGRRSEVQPDRPMNVSAMTRPRFLKRWVRSLYFGKNTVVVSRSRSYHFLICGGLHAGVFQRFSGRVWRAVCLWLQLPAVPARYRIAPVKPP